MYVEKLQLELKASGLGWKPVKPPVIKGVSGVDHTFSFVASSGKTTYAFDIYDRVTLVEVITSYAKKYDTDSSVNLVCSRGYVDPEAKVMAKEYGMEIVSVAEIGQFFDSNLMRASKGNPADAKKMNASA